MFHHTNTSRRANWPVKLGRHNSLAAATDHPSQRVQRVPGRMAFSTSGLEGGRLDVDGERTLHQSGTLPK